MKTKPFSELRNRMKPEQRRKSETLSKLISFHLNLIELQELLQLLQDDLNTKIIHVESTISEFDNPEDIQISRSNEF